MISKNHQRGATAIEYALIAGLIAAVLVVALGILGGGLEQGFQNIADCLTGDGCSFGSE